MGSLERLTVLTRELRIPPGTGENLAVQLSSFVESQKGNWVTHRAWVSPFIEKGERTKKLDVKFITPTELHNVGVGESFLVVWNHTTPGTSGGFIVPMEIWLARGVYTGKIGDFKALFVTYIEVGQLKHGDSEIQFAGKGPLQGSIYLNSDVIMKPQQKAA